MLHLSKWHLFHEFLFVYLFILSDTDVIMKLLHYFVCCINHSFQLWRKSLTRHWTTHNWCIHWPVAFMTQNKHVCQMRTF